MSLLQTIELNKSFGENHVINDVNFSVTEGEVMALVGPNGAGKTSLVNLLSAYLSPDHGKILFQGAEGTQIVVEVKSRAAGRSLPKSK